MKNTLYITVFSFLLFGCANPISQPIASRPLVEEVYNSPNINKVPKSLLGALSNLPLGALVEINGQKMLLEEQYYSANGKSCRRMTLVDRSRMNKSPLVVCKKKEDESWLFAQQIMSKQHDNGAGKE